jgi:hypothetical protein
LISILLLCALAGCGGVLDDDDTYPNSDPNDTSIDSNGCDYSQQDDDGDGVPNGSDDFINSNDDPTVLIGTCDSSVDNQFVSNGANFSDLIGAITARNHGDYVKQVTKMANGWKKDGLISGKDQGKITSCAAKSDLP